MVSLNYKNNVLKTLLYEKITPIDIDDIKDNEKKSIDIIEKLRKSGSEDILIRKDGSSTFLYVLKNLNAKSFPKSGSLFVSLDSNNAKEKSPTFYCIFDTYELGQHGGLISNYEEEVTIMLQTDSLNYPESFLNTKQNYFDKSIKKSEIINYVKNEIQKINDEISKNIKTNGKIDVEKIDYSSEDYLRKLKNYSKNDFEEIERDKNGKPIDPFLNHKNLLKSSGKRMYRFTPSKLIEDEKYRTIPELKQKVQGTLRNFDNQQEKLNKFTPFMLASSVIHELIGDPFKKVDIDSSLFDSNQKIKSLYKKSNIDLDFKDKENKNMIYSNNQTELIHKFLLAIVADPNEILATEAVSEMKNINWSQNSNGKSAKEEILSVFGTENDFKNALASFPKESNVALIDSYLMIQNDGKYRQLGISTKGGVNGQGAPASITSLFRFLFDDESIKFNGWGYEKELRASIKTGSQHNRLLEVIQNDIVPKMSTLGKNYWKINPEILSYIIIFGGTSPAYHKPIIQSMIDNKFMGIKYNTKSDSENIIEEFGAEITSRGITKMVMDLLDKQKYKFCQVNTTPKFVGNQISFTYDVQYPARFSGEVKFEPDIPRKGLRFHIMGSVK